MLSKAKIPIIIYLSFLLVLVVGCAGGAKPGVTMGDSADGGKTPEVSAGVTEQPSPEISYITDTDFPEKYKISNDPEAVRLINKEYSLKELTDYFGTDRYFENSYFVNIQEHISIDDVNSRFPLECTRQNEESGYTIYTVKEGGRYFVFWVPSLNGGYYASSTVYKINLKNINDFNTLEVNKSTYNDVLKIDPSTEYDLSGESNQSISLLDDGNILHITYINAGARITGENLVIESMKVKNIESGRLNFLIRIYKFDLDF